MSDLNATPARTERPASEFPEPADVYLCDDCKTDITSHLFPGKSHTWRAMGPERYTCACGRKYLTGAVEWDHLSVWERRSRAVQTHGVAILFSIMLAVPALVFFFLLAWLLHWKAALGALAVLISLPFLAVEAAFWFAVAASKRRTR
jgi:hypothetical protein